MLWSKRRFCAAVAICTADNTRLQELQQIGAVNGWVDDKAIVVVRDVRMYDIDWHHLYVCFFRCSLRIAVLYKKREKEFRVFSMASCGWPYGVRSRNARKRCVVWSNQKLAKQCCCYTSGSPFSCVGSRNKKKERYKTCLLRFVCYRNTDEQYLEM